MNNNNNNKILLVDDENNLLVMLSAVLSKEGYNVTTACEGQEALHLLEKDKFSAVITDLSMPGMDGFKLLEALNGKIPTIVMSAYGSTDSALKATKLGAQAYVFKPFQPEEILFNLKQVLTKENLKKENLKLKEASGTGTIIFKSQEMQNLMLVINKYAEVKSPVLIFGESGTGKELVARALHKNSSRSQTGEFVAVNCGAINESLLESELFGHVKGAFTSAIKSRDGLFKAADKGTLFLDELNEIPLSFQVKLLRAIQFEEIRAVGSEEAKTVDVRIICASSENIKNLISEGLFREDLYYRLNVLPIDIPPLRDRKDDIPILIDHFLKKLSLRLNIKRPQISPDFMETLSNYAWPGNIRELENLIDRILVLNNNAEILTADVLPKSMLEQKIPTPTPKNNLNLKTALMSLEKTYIEFALKKSAGNRSEASRILEISYPSLLSKIKLYNIK